MLPNEPVLRLVLSPGGKSGHFVTRSPISIRSAEFYSKLMAEVHLQTILLMGFATKTEVESMRVEISFLSLPKSFTVQNRIWCLDTFTLLPVDLN
jgi:hypothetical protein